MVLEKTLESPLDSKEIKPVNPKGSHLNIHWKDWRWSSNSSATWCKEPTHWKRPWCWKRLKAREGGNRGLDSWMASSTQRTWVWANSGRWGRTGEPGVLQYMGLQSQTRLSDWTARNAASIKISEERHLEASQLVSIGRCWESDRPGEDAEAPCLP